MEIVLSFFVGILTSGIVGFFIYRRQKSESSLSERQILLLLSQQSKLTERIDDKLSANQSVFEKTFKDIQNEFRSAVREHDIEGALVSGAKYIDAAGSIADLNAKSLVQSNSDISHLTIEKLMKIHESIFPRGY